MKRAKTKPPRAEDLANLRLAALEQTSEGIAICDLEGYVQYVNPAFAAMHGYPPERLLGRHLTIFHDPAQMPAVEEANRQLKETGSFEGEIWHVRCDGSSFLALMYNSLLRSPSGEAVGLIGTAVDITERRRTEMMLQESEVRYRSLFDRMPVGLYRTTPGGEIVAANLALVHLLGYPDRDSLLGTNANSLYVESIERRQLLQEIERSNVACSLEFQLRKYDGTPVWVKESALPIRDSEGAVVWYEGSLEDITERKQAEQELRIAHGRLEATLDALPDLLFEVDSEARILDYRANHPEKLYVSSEAFLGKTMAEVLPEPAAGIILEAIREALETGRSEGATYALEMPDQTRCFELSIARRWDPEATKVRLLMLVRDITERRQAEDALRKERDFSMSLIQASPTFFVAISAEGRTLLMNEAMLTALGYVKEEVVGTNYMETFVPKADHEPLARVFDRLVHQREPTHSENRVLARDGRALPVEWYGRPVFKVDGKLDYFFGVGIDITERRHAEEQRAIVEAQLRHAHKMQAVGQLAAGVAHDFNSILTVILGNTERSLSKMKHGQFDNSAGVGMQLIMESVERGRTLVQRLLTLGGATTARNQTLDLNLIVTDMERMLRPLIGDHIEVEVTQAAQIRPISADPVQIEEVIMNLVFNARDAMPDGGKLTIQTADVELDEARAGACAGAKPRPQTMLAVCDTGVGMDEETLERVFEPFYTTKPVDQGTGLGLSIVHGIVTQAGGNIEVTSEPGNGTTFRLYFPAAE